MNKTRLVTLSAMLAVPMLLLASAWSDAAPSPADGQAPDAVAATAPDPATRYRAECGSCHTPYPARTLPAPAWRQIMGRLDNHYDDNAELPAETQALLTRYLVDHAGRASRYRAPAGDKLPRITEQPWFTGEHDEIPARMVTGNPKVGSFSNCAGCHTGAAQGRFSEHEVRIPGYGRWED